MRRKLIVCAMVTTLLGPGSAHAGPTWRIAAVGPVEFQAPARAFVVQATVPSFEPGTIVDADGFLSYVDALAGISIEVAITCAQGSEYLLLPVFYSRAVQLGGRDATGQAYRLYMWTGYDPLYPVPFAELYRSPKPCSHFFDDSAIVGQFDPVIGAIVG